jgi:DNA-binding GntR family transcriptional regulator
MAWSTVRRLRCRRIMERMPRPAEPPSVRVERELRERVAGMASGDQLPNINVLASEHHTSKTTVQRVLAKLAAEGLVTVRPGWGTHRA